jgi:hypothetical protein
MTARIPQLFAISVRLLPTVLIVVAVVYINFTAVACFDTKFREDLRRGGPPSRSVLVEGSTDRALMEVVDFHFGWPTTWCVRSELAHVRHIGLGGYEYSLPTYERAFFSPVHFFINLIWTVGMAAGTWAVCGKVTEIVRHAQFSLSAIMLALAITGLGIFLICHYDEGIDLWVDAEVGRPYLLLSGLYRWFGPRSPYDWLQHFDIMVRLPLLIGWLCMVGSACRFLLVAARLRCKARQASIEA